MRLCLIAASAVLLFSTPVLAQNNQGNNGCSIPSTTVTKVQNQLAGVVKSSDGNGGLFIPHPNQMWSAVVDRAGILCSVIKVGDAWPGSRDIAIAKASTANDFSNDLFALSTANLYAATQPGGSLYGLNNSNPFNPSESARSAPGSSASVRKTVPGLFRTRAARRAIFGPTVG